MKVVVVGPAQAGKSTFGNMLARELKTKAHDTSEPLVRLEEERQQVLNRRYGIFHQAWWDEQRARPSREYLVAIGDAIVDQFGADTLSQWCFQHGDVCVGVRRHSELEVLKLKRPDVKVVWVERPGSGDSQDNLDFGPPECDYVVQNNGSLEELRAQARALALDLLHS